jgi:aminocarboxymuconate-semialdehyde decarboxylase
VIVDVHCHTVARCMLTDAVPEDWRPQLRTDNERWVLSFRHKVIDSVADDFAEPELMLARAEAAGISHLVLSPWIMLVPVLAEPAEAARICRVQNEGLAELAASRGDGRISVLGAVPLQDAAAAVAELDYLMRLPGMCGVEVPASVAGSYLGEPRFLPFWEAAESTGALVFVHPATTGLGLPALTGHYLWNSVGNPLETAITAAQLMTGGVLERHQGLKVVLAHGGGALLTLRGRLARAHQVRPEARADSEHSPADSLRQLYYDSLTHDADVLRDLLAFAGAEHVLLGSDRPFDMGTPHPVQDVQAAGLSPDDEGLVLGGNAARLLGLADA